MMSFIQYTYQWGWKDSWARNMSIPKILYMIHYRISNFYTQTTSNPLHFLYSFSLNARLKSPESFLHTRASGNRSKSPLRPANEPAKRSDHNPRHPAHGGYFTLISSMENDSTDSKGNVYTPQECPRGLYLLQLSPSSASSLLEARQAPEGDKEHGFPGD